MRANRCLVLLWAAQLFAQDQGAPKFPQILAMISDPVFETTEVLNAIDKANLAISFDQSTLSSIIESSRTGKRPPNEVAQLIIRLMRECRYCRDQFWSPLGPDDVRTALGKGSEYTLEEVRVRGTKNLPLDVPFYSKLAADGASPELVGVLEDKLTIAAPDGFKAAKLDKAADFNPQSDTGKLTMHVELAGEAVFLFRHNALFFSTLKGEEPAILSATYSAFGPAKAEPTWNVRVTPKLAKGKKLKKVMDTAKSTVPDGSGRPGLQWAVNNPDKDRHEYEIEITWTR